jgi:putative tryptophan/tyrosine transport system permease protein
MLGSGLTVLELGFLYGILTLAIVVSFRFLRFPDLTVDGSFVLGAVLAGVSLRSGESAIFGLVFAATGGFIAGLVTVFCHRVLGVNKFFSGILTAMMLYSCNLRIMGSSNISLLDFRGIFGDRSFATSGDTAFIALIIFAITALIIAIFFISRVGLLLRALGSNSDAISHTRVRGTALLCLGLGLSNALAALAGACIAHYQKFVDASMGIGISITGFASLFLGEAILIGFLAPMVTVINKKYEFFRRFIGSGGAVIVGELSAAALGTIGFMFCITMVLYLGLVPSDTKFFAACLLLLGFVARGRAASPYLVAASEFEK